jgi:hypothetical protein
MELKQTDLILNVDCVWNSYDRLKNFKAPDDSGFKIVDGVWFIPKGTKWDGTTGVPDGIDDPNKPGFPITWQASLIHDIGCRYWYYKSFPYKRSQLDKYFFKLLEDVNFNLSWLYFIGVRINSIYLEILYKTIFSKK